MDLWYFDDTEIINTTQLVYEMLAADGVEVCKEELFAEMYTLAISENQYERWNEIKRITIEIVESSAHSRTVQRPVQKPPKHTLKVQRREEYICIQCLKATAVEIFKLQRFGISQKYATLYICFSINLSFIEACYRPQISKLYKRCFHILIFLFLEKKSFQNCVTNCLLQCGKFQFQAIYRLHRN